MYRMKQLLAKYVISTCENANCKEDGDEVLVPLELISSFTTKKSNVNEAASQFNDADPKIMSNYFSNGKPSAMYKLNTSAYVAGYLARKLKKNI